jgi:hypothetical protein
MPLSCNRSIFYIHPCGHELEDDYRYFVWNNTLVLYGAEWDDETLDGTEENP